MRLRVTFLAALVGLVLGTASANAQQTGEIYGKVTDSSGAVLPGATVTISGGPLLQPLAATTSESGTFRFPQLLVGEYKVKFDLPGFKTIVNNKIYVGINFNAQVNASMEVSTVQETVTVTSEAPIVDTRKDGTRASSRRSCCRTCPSARDPWVMLQRTAGHRDGPRQHRRQPVGPAVELRLARRDDDQQQVDGRRRRRHRPGRHGRLAGVLRLRHASRRCRSRRAARRDAADRRRRHQPRHQERQRHAPRVGPLLHHRRQVRAHQHHRGPARAGRAVGGTPIQNIKDYGVEGGGPIWRGRAWFWGAYGKQDIKVGVVSFYKKVPGCPAERGRSARAVACRSTRSTTASNTDLTMLDNYNMKGSALLF